MACHTWVSKMYFDKELGYHILGISTFSLPIMANYHNINHVYNGLTSSGYNQNASANSVGSPFYPGQTIESALTGMYAQVNSCIKYNINDSGHTVIRTYSNTLDLDELAEMIPVIKKRLLILDPLFSKHDLYPALKKAYDDYLLIAKMIDGDESSS